jgi:hypothetical protein
VIYVQINFPVEARKLAAMLAAANECWPGCYSGIDHQRNCVLVSEEPLGVDAMRAHEAAQRIISPVSVGGARWGERNQ